MRENIQYLPLTRQFYLCGIGDLPSIDDLSLRRDREAGKEEKQVRLGKIQKNCPYTN